METLDRILAAFRNGQPLVPAAGFALFLLFVFGLAVLI